MVNINTLLLVSERKEFRQRLRTIFEEEYNLLECRQIDLARLMMDQNSKSIAAVLLDVDTTDEAENAKNHVLYKDGQSRGIPVVAVLSRKALKMECDALATGASEVVTEKSDSEILRCRVRIMVRHRREWFRLMGKVDRQNEMLLHSNERMMDTLTSLIEYRSAESNLHILRIRRFTKILLDEVAKTCPEYGLDERMIAEIASASAMHDIGKIGIPDAILNKPGKFLPEERKVMETHSIIGAQIVERMKDVVDPSYLKYAYNICKYHHERWDGNGYPTGISGDDIPICAQVAGLADVYDALTTRRVYKDAYAAESAVQMILNGECGLFSPKLLECFKMVRKQFFNLSKYYSDDRKVREDKVVDLELPSPVYQSEISSLHKTQSKYHLLLNYINATVVELEPSLQNYHVVYNPASSLALLNTGATFRQSVDNLLERYARPEERREVADRIFHYLHQQTTTGIKRLTFDVSFGGGYTLRKYAYKITLLSMDKTDADSRALIMIWSKKQDTAAMETAVSGESEAQRLFERIAHRCFIRNDLWMTMEDGGSIASLLGYAPKGFEEKFQNRLINVIAVEDRQAFMEQISEQLNREAEIEIIVPMHHADGRNVYVLLKGRTYVDDNGVEKIVAVLVRLDTAYEHAGHNENRINRFTEILDQHEHALFEWDLLNDRFVYAKNWEKIFGYEPGDQKVSELLRNSVSIHPDDLEKMEQLLARGIMGRKNVKIDLRVLRADGRYNWQRVVAVVEYARELQPKRVNGIIFNVDQEKRSEQMLQQKTEVDALTRLLNKEAGRRYAEECLADHQEKEQSALLLIDLDNFKGVNDRYGHMFGDAVLCETAMVIRKHFRPDDIVARIGGDEFMVMMRLTASRELVDKRCGALCQSLKEHLAKLVHEGDVSCSIGVALAPEHANNYSELFQRADQALYMSKKRGKNTYSVYDSGYMNLSIPETFSTRIESDDNPGLTDSGIVRYAFKRLYEAKDEDEAINGILAMIGEQMNVDRVYIFEDSADGQYCSNTYEWCNEGVEPQIENLQNIHYDNDVAGFRESFNEHGIFYCPDIEKLSEPVYSILKAQDIKSMLACAIREKGVFRGYVGFDECSDTRIWTKEQIEVLTFFSEMLAVFLFKMRAQKKTAQYASNLASILDSRPEYIYVIEAETYEVKFVNSKARQKFSGIGVGKRCFEIINGSVTRCEDCPTRKAQISVNAMNEMDCMKMGWMINIEASLIQWQGKDAYLIVCTDSEQPEESGGAMAKTGI